MTNAPDAATTRSRRERGTPNPSLESTNGYNLASQSRNFELAMMEPNAAGVSINAIDGEHECVVWWGEEVWQGDA